MAFKKVALAVCVLAHSLLSFPMEFKEGTSLEDSEINSFFGQVIGPVIESSRKIRPAKVYLIKSHTWNAFALAEPHIFIFSRVIEQESLESVVGVLLHEMGHIAGHHVMRGEDALRTEKSRGLLSAIAGAAVAGVTLNPAALLAGLDWWATSTMSKMMCHSREHEHAADFFAVESLKKLGWPVQAIEEVMQILSKLTAGQSVPAYFRTHPYASERLRAIQAKGYQKGGVFPDSMKDSFQRVKTKIVAFCSPLESAERRVDRLPVDDFYKLYGRAICAYRKGLFDKALSILSTFESRSGGETPYTNELRSEILLDKGEKDRALSAINRSLSSRPKDFLFILQKVHILFERSQYKNCVRLLESLSQKGRSFPKFWHWMGRCLYKTEKLGASYVCQAEEAILLGQKDRAKHFVEMAARHFSKGDQSPYALRAMEIKRDINVF